MKILKGILIALALLLGIGFFLPGSTHVERSIDINTSANKVYDQVNELKNWNNWSPWSKLDPNTAWTYSEPSSAGVGAHYSWKSDKIGNGKMTILDTKPNESVKYKLEFEGMGESGVSFLLTAKDSTQTKAVWTMDTDNGMNPINRWMGLFTEKMLGPDYEKGLANLKAYCETTK